MRCRLIVTMALIAGCSHARATSSDLSLSGAASPVDLAEAARAADDGGETSCALATSGTWLDLVDAVVVAMRAGGNAGSEALAPPTAADRDAFAARVVAILGGDEASACALPPSYRLLHLNDAHGALRVIVEVDGSGKPAPSLYWGTYAAPLTTPATSRRLAIEAPHPIFDANTEHQSADLFQQAGARWFLLAGAHRCADAASSGCDGTTTACDPTAASYRVSDAAHATQLPFWAVHAQLSQLDGQLLFIQLHGNSDMCPAALVSDGSGSWSDSDAAGRLAAALIARSVAVGKCGAGYPTSGCTLCGTDNVEGRFTAGAADACTMLGTTYGRFVHIEQQPALRTSYQPLIDAVNATF